VKMLEDPIPVPVAPRSNG